MTKETRNGKPVHYGSAPFSAETHELVDEKSLKPKDLERVEAYEVCDGGGGRCKCGSRCVRAVMRRPEAEIERLQAERQRREGWQMAMLKAMTDNLRNPPAKKAKPGG